MENNNKRLVLIVDDQPKNLQLLAAVLYRNNYDVAMATSGKEALAILEENTPDLILLDIMMPEMDGFEVMREIQSSKICREIPVIFLTAKNDDETIIKSFEYGSADYITKPFNAGEMLSRVNTHIELSSKRKQLSEMNEILEDKVKQRTEELRKANIRISKLDEAKSNFISLLSHELKTPVNGIKGFANILKKELISQEHKEYCDFIIQSSDRLERFTELSLLITKLKSEHYEFCPEENNINVLIKETIFNLQEVISNKNIKINTMPNENIQIVNADSFLISQSLKLIIENAVKFNNTNGKIDIELTKDEKNLIVEIRDDGPGFPEIVLQSDIDMFTSNKILNHSEGTGLGLATVKTIMNYHSGDMIIMNSDEGAVVKLIFVR